MLKTVSENLLNWNRYDARFKGPATNDNEQERRRSYPLFTLTA